jgi:hypothetical protein
METILANSRREQYNDQRSLESAQRIADASDQAAEAIYEGSTQVAVPLLYALAAMIAFGLVCVPVVIILRFISEIRDAIDTVVNLLSSIFSFLDRHEQADDDDGWLENARDWIAGEERD